MLLPKTVKDFSCYLMHNNQDMELTGLKKNSCMKGHHIFKSAARTRDRVICARGPGNPHSSDAMLLLKSAIAVLSAMLHPVLDYSGIEVLVGTASGVTRPASEGF